MVINTGFTRDGDTIFIHDDFRWGKSGGWYIRLGDKAMGENWVRVLSWNKVAVFSTSEEAMAFLHREGYQAPTYAKLIAREGDGW